MELVYDFFKTRLKRCRCPTICQLVAAPINDNFLRANRQAGSLSDKRALMTTTYFAAIRRPGALWNPDKTARDQPFWNEHAQFMDAMFGSGVVILGGPFKDGTGSLVIVTAHSAEQVHEMFRSDPWTEQDVLRIGDVKEWAIFLDARERN